MKVTVERAELLRSLSHVHRVVERRNTIPILANVLVRTNGALDFVYYVVAGLGWVPLAMLLISWMSRGERPNNNS